MMYTPFQLVIIHPFLFYPILNSHLLKEFGEKKILILDCSVITENEIPFTTRLRNLNLHQKTQTLKNYNFNNRYSLLENTHMKKLFSI